MTPHTILHIYWYIVNVPWYKTWCSFFFTIFFSTIDGPIFWVIVTFYHLLNTYVRRNIATYSDLLNLNIILCIRSFHTLDTNIFYMNIIKNISMMYVCHNSLLNTLHPHDVRVVVYALFYRHNTYTNIYTWVIQHQISNLGYVDPK